jgi:signal recognition particle GTPase
MWFRRSQPEPTPPPEVPPASGGQENSEFIAGDASTEPADAPKRSWWGRAWETLNKPVFDKDEEWAIKTRERVAQTRALLVNRVQVLVLGRGRIDDDLLEELEEILISADVGVETTDDLLAHVRVLAREQALKPAGIPATCILSAAVLAQPG